MNWRNGYDFTLWDTTGLNQQRGAAPTENVADQGQNATGPSPPPQPQPGAAGHIGNSDWLFASIRQAQIPLVPDLSRGSTPASPTSADEEAMQNVPSTPDRPPCRCLVCEGSDHMIQPQRDQAPPTPDPGPNLAHGRFMCTGCFLLYEAVVIQSSVINQYSSCPRCGGANLPYAMYPLPPEIRAILQYDAQGYHQDNGPPF